MGAGELNDENLAQSQLLRWQRHHPYLFALTRTFIWFYAKIREALSIIFATWPSMHDPIKYLLNVADVQEADILTEKWTKAKLKELQYVGLSVRRRSLPIAIGHILSLSWF